MKLFMKEANDEKKKKKRATKSLCSKTGNQSDLELVVLNNQHNTWWLPRIIYTPRGEREHITPFW